jgi:hypothetical protein
MIHEVSGYLPGMSRDIIARGDLLDLAPPKGPTSTKGTDALRELREDRA